MSGEIFSIDQDQISLYFHVPFCKKKCDYCHFYVIPDRDPFKSDYMEGLRLDWRNWQGVLLDRKICSVYFGGGTPSLLGPSRISEILSWVRNLRCFSNDIEITLEANPDDISFDLMKRYADAGINRVSVGVQSLDDSLLSMLSRQHNADKAKNSVLKVQEAGIGNISIDLMYDIPHQTAEQWEKTLDEALALPITHLSLYNLVFEPHTVFYKKKESLRRFLPDEAVSTKMYQKAVDKCYQAGIFQYEISAFEKPGYYSRHNIGYWQGRPFLGFGPSAFSYWQGKRFRNVANLNRYLEGLKCGGSAVDYEEVLVGQRKLRELLAVNLRVLQGVDLKKFQEMHGVLDRETLLSLEKLSSEGLLQFQGDIVQLTQHGTLFYDTVASEVI